MFKRRKSENKAKIEHKLYLARENPEPVFDLTDCDLHNVPQGIFSLCKVFLKETLLLNGNQLTSLSGGGQLKDLCLLKVLDLRSNKFISLPNEINQLTHLEELFVSNNHLTSLPSALCDLSTLKCLDLSSNYLKKLPDDLGNLKSLQVLNVACNKNLKTLPKTLCKAVKLKQLDLDVEQYSYPPSEVVKQGIETIMIFISNDSGFEYEAVNEDVQDTSSESGKLTYSDYDRTFSAKIWELETIKQKKAKEFLEIERHNELLQMQELEHANAQKINREKLLADITYEQNKFDNQLIKWQKLRDQDRFCLIEQLHEAEQNSCKVIQQLLALNKEPSFEILQAEKMEEQRLLEAANKYNEQFKKAEILQAMQEVLFQETCQLEQHYQNRIEMSKSILQEEIELDSKMGELLQSKDVHRAELMAELLEDMELQKAMVATLLTRSDCRSWSLIQQVSLVETQLAALTQIELDRRKLRLDEHVNDLAERRVTLSNLLVDLLQQQETRKAEILSTIKNLEDHWNNAENYWLKQYQSLLERMPENLMETQKCIDPLLAQMLLMNGVLHCLPYLARILQKSCDLENVDEDLLIESGLTNTHDRSKVLEVFHSFVKTKSIDDIEEIVPSAPPGVEEPSAPPTLDGSDKECVVCMEREYQVIFVPCGHLCCCVECSADLTECPLCRSVLERKIKTIAA